MLLVVNIIKFVFLMSFSLVAHGRDVYILTLGQSISSNCNEYIFQKYDGVYQVDKNGQIKIASDPFEWADCTKGSMWMPLGSKMISEGIATRVIFMPIGVAGSRAGDWLSKGKSFNKLTSALDIAVKKNIRFDYALWHQGSSDIGMDAGLYGIQLTSVLKYISSRLYIDKWIIASHSKCFDKYDSSLEFKQKEIAASFMMRRFAGPDTNKLTNKYRYDGCHLNKLGQEKMADLWLESIIKADSINEIIQKETLLKYFRM